ncbi:aldo/keto reductase [Skermanella mucosa]|uniref:aldo/keto reductase n=1 Tax=Skermanella mucosa TaxID=1789672 RepID=UPI00192C3DBA|nr:aldo/keto reductase [Skermanella mucosa]UEM22211.1 aldo/keto reductase [Skermanella mucosa]
MELETRKLGRTDVSLTAFGFGGTSLGNMYRAIDDEAAMAALDASFAAGVRYVDTAPLYGHGLSEHRVGGWLRRVRGENVVLSTKVGWRLFPARGEPTEAGLFMDVPPFRRGLDYSYDGVMRSFEDSLHRLGTDRVDIVFIHDADRRNQGDAFEQRFKEAMEGAYPALLKLREQGVVKAIGAGLNEWEACQRFAEAGDFDCFLLAGRYTLLDQESLDSFMPLCEKRGIGIVLGGPYNSGILATGPVEGAHYDYAPASPEILEKTRRIEEICRRHGVPLKAAALQFPLGHPVVASVIPGMGSPARIKENMDLLAHKIPSDLWAELRSDGLIRQDAPLP